MALIGSDRHILYILGSSLSSGGAAAYTCADGSPFMNQTCFNCDVPAANTSCDVPRYYQYTLEQCQIAVDGTIVYMSEYQIDKLLCKRYSCFLDELDIFSFRPLRALTKPTCISGKEIQVSECIQRFHFDSIVFKLQ